MSPARTVTSILALLIVMAGAPAAAAPTPQHTPTPTEMPDFSGSIGGLGRDEEGVIDVEAELELDGTPGTDGTSGSVETAGDEAEPAPEGVWISVSDIVFVTDPPCILTTSEFLEGVTAEEADVIRWTRINQFVVEYEAYISAGNEPPPACDDGDGTPGVGPTPSQQFTDSAHEILPAAEPTISGGYAITGLRSWLDLHRTSTLTATHEFMLGPATATATITATATATIDWGDGTVTTHTSSGGGYHEGDPGPDDITHTYRDSADSNTLTVTDTWDVTISFPDAPVPDITLTWEASDVLLTFPIREVRSTRDR